MPTVWNFDEDDQTNSMTGGGAPRYYRVHGGRSEENINNTNEGGLRIENEDGIELWFSVDPATNDDNGYMAWVDDSGGVDIPDNWNDTRTGDGNFYHAAYNGPGNPDADQLDPDVVVIAPSERDANGNITGRMVGTADDPVTLDFKSGLGIWKVTFHAENGSTVEVEIGTDDRQVSAPYEDWLIGWNGETASAVGTFTHITVESLTVALIELKNPVFVLDSLSMDSYFCFLEGTLIDTPDGAVPVETLREGDLVLTSDGRETPVLWLGEQFVPTPFVPREVGNPIRIAANAIADGVPRRDLFVSPDHAICIDDILYNANVLVNGTTIHQVERMPMNGFMYYHVETEAHELILAEGCPAETFIDFAGRDRFRNFAAYCERFGEGRVIPEMALMRVPSKRLLPQAIRERLARRAEAALAPDEDQVGAAAA